jgi:hypothetical protein
MGGVGPIIDASRVATNLDYSGMCYGEGYHSRVRISGTPLNRPRQRCPLELRSDWIWIDNGSIQSISNLSILSTDKSDWTWQSHVHC